MFLVTAATRFELDAFTRHYQSGQVRTLITGVGLVETATSLSAYLAKMHETIEGVINIGIGGAYVFPDSAQMLDLCLATGEVLGDLGICHENSIERLPENFVPNQGFFSLQSPLQCKAEKILKEQGYALHSGTFVSVHCVTATDERGQLLATMHHGICENMEGAAVARVCEEFALPMVELRSISNLVEARDKQRWQIKEAVGKCGQAAAVMIQGLLT